MNFLRFGKATKVKPQWNAQFATFREGNPIRPIVSLLGSGKLLSNPMQNTFQPTVVYYSMPDADFTGSGKLISDPLYLQPLLDNGRKNTTQI